MNSTAEYYKFCHSYEERSVSISEFPESKQIHLFLVVLTVLDGLLIIPTVLLNITAVKTILKSPKLKEKPCFFLILVQSVFDTGVGAIALPLYTVGLATETAGVPNCWANFLFSKISIKFAGCSFITLSAMSFERYMGIFHPLTHRVEVTKGRLLKYIIGSILVTLFMTFVSLKFRNAITIATSIYAFVFMIFTTFVYLRIFAFAKKRIRSRTSRASEGAAELSSSEMKENRQILQETKLAKSCFLVVICYLICFLPSGFTFLLSHLDRFLARIVFAFIMTLTFLNATLNSIIFFWRNPILRRSVKSNPFSCLRK